MTPSPGTPSLPVRAEPYAYLPPVKTRSSEPDWASLAQAILDREPRPAAVVDRTARVRAANPAMARLLGWARAELKGRSWVEAAGIREDEEARRVRLLFEDERHGPRNVELACTPRRGERLTLVAGLQPLGRGPRSAVLLTAEDVRVGAASGAPLPVRGFQYAVSSRDGEFGILQHVWAFEPASKANALRQRCYEALYGRDNPCPGCPAPRLEADSPHVLTSIVRRSKPTPRFDVTTARAHGPSSVQVNVWPIDEELLGQLVAAKIDDLAERAGLSERERAVLDLVLLGQSRDQIASALRISVSTVKYHQRNLERKMGAESRMDLFRLILV